MSSGSGILSRTLLSLLPLALTPVLFHALAGGVLNLGGGEKDVLFVLPWLLWALAFAVSCWILWLRGHGLGAGLRRAALIGLCSLVLAAMVLVVAGQLGDP